MNNSTEFCTKFFNTRLKYGDTKQTFLSYFDMTEDDFDKRIESTFSKSFISSFYRQLKKNEKMIKPRKHKSTQFVKVQKEIENRSEEEVLKEQISILESQQVSLEEEHLKLENSSNEERAKLREVKDQVLEVRKQLSKLAKQINSSTLIINQNLEKMQEITRNISNIREDIAQKQDRIDEINKINIFVYDNGEIETDNGTKCEIPESWNNLYQSMVDGSFGNEEVLETLTLKQLKQFSKLKCFIDSLEVKYELTIENPDFGKAWELLKP